MPNKRIRLTAVGPQSAVGRLGRMTYSCDVCGAPMPPDATYCSQCGALHPRPRPRPTNQPGPRPPQRPWLPYAILGMALTVLAGGAMLGILVTRGGATPQPSPTPQLATTTAPVPTVTPSDAATPEPSPGPTPAAAAVIPNMAIVEVSTDTLNLRAGPSQSSMLATALREGRRLFVIGSPTEAEGLRWYRVGTSDAPPACELDCELVGYVATPLDAEESWIRRVQVDCPTSPVSADRLGQMPRLEALHCYGRNPLLVTGTVDVPLHGPITPLRHSPEWLAAWSPQFLRGAWWLEFHAAPDSGLVPPDRGDVVTVNGHFDDPAAVDCRVRVDADFFGGELPPDFQPPSTAWAVLACRATFVWDHYEVVGFEDLGPCCGSLPVVEERLAHTASRGS